MTTARLRAVDLVLTESNPYDTLVANRLIRRHAEGDLDRSHLQQIDEFLESGTMDQDDVRRLTDMLDQRGSDPLIDDSIDADDLLEAARDGDLSDTQAITLRNRNVYRLEGSGKFGWEHIEGRHVEGSETISSGKTTFFPKGQDVTRGGSTVTFDNVLDERDIKETIINAIKQEDRDTGDGGLVYTLTDHEYDDLGEIRVVIHEGNNEVITAYPDIDSSYSYPYWDGDTSSWKNV